MSKSKRTLLRSLLVGILSIAPVAGLAVTTSTGPMNGSSSSNTSMDQTVVSQQNDQMNISSSGAVVETPVGGAGADVDVPWFNPEIDVGVDTVTPDVGVSVTSMQGDSSMVVHPDSNGVYEAPSAIAPPREGENGVPVQPVPNSPPGGTIGNQPPLAPNGGFSASHNYVNTTPSTELQAPNTGVSGVSVEPTYYRGHAYRGHVYYTNRGYYGPHYHSYYYRYQPYDYSYPYRGYAYYPYQDYYQYYNYNWGW